MLVSAYALLVVMVSLLLELWAGPKGIKIGGVPIPMVISATTFAIIADTFISGVRNLPLTHSLGMWLLYMIVTIYISDVTNLYKMAGKAYWVFVLFGAYWLLLAIHLSTMTLAAKLLKVDWTTTAVASIANIGGAVTAPICANVYGVAELVPDNRNDGGPWIRYSELHSVLPLRRSTKRHIPRCYSGRIALPNQNYFSIQHLTASSH